MASKQVLFRSSFYSEPLSNIDQNIMSDDDQQQTHELTFPDDIVFHVMQFLESTFLGTTCTRVCKQWYSQVCQVPLSLDFSRRRKNQSLPFDVVHGINTMLNITKLDLTLCSIGDEGVKFISNCDFKNLKILCLWYNNIGSQGAGYIASSMKNLMYLDLYYNNIGVKGSRWIATSEHLKHLTYLNIGFNQIKCAGIKALCSSPHSCQNLVTLKIGGSTLGVEGAIYLSTCERLQKLNHLDVSYSKLGAEGAKHIASSVFLKNLTHLSMNGNNIEDDGVKSIATSAYMKHLKELRLERNNIGNEGAKYISQSEHMRTLMDLDLCLNKIGDKGATYIGTSEVLKHLQVLDLSQNEMTAHGVGVIRQHLTDLLYFHH